MKVFRNVIAVAALVLATSAPSLAARTDLVLGMVLEPPHLNPTAAIDEVVYRDASRDSLSSL